MNGALLHKWRFKLRMAEESWGNFDKRLKYVNMALTAQSTPP
jgi:hypothetical protein